MISREKLYELSTKFGHHSSWAIWNPKDITDLSVIESNHMTLQSKVVMVALNISAKVDKPWQNFHVGKNDYKLKKAFNDTSYRGAYMTDLIKVHTNPNSKEVLNNLTEDDLQKSFDRFYEEMNTLEATQETLFILFGNYVKEIFLQGPIFHYNNIVCCQHYAYYGLKTEEWIKKTHNILRQHQKRTNSIFGTNPFVAPKLN